MNRIATERLSDEATKRNDYQPFVASWLCRFVAALAFTAALPAPAGDTAECELARHRHFTMCWTGPIGDDPDRPPWILPAADCLWFDGDGDLDIDLRDWGRWWSTIERMKDEG